MLLPPLRIALVGCGALTELYYAPSILALATAGNLQVRILLDPNRERLAILGAVFPDAQQMTQIEKINPDDIDFAIVASPPRFHCEQTESLLNLGIHVLCEKPMAGNADQARRMVKCAEHSSSLLSVALFRRFFPSTEMVHDLISKHALGAPLSFQWSEGGVFNWSAASPSFFQRSASAGGVLADAGTHVLDLLISWFGAPDNFIYHDDALGGLEANASLDLSFAQDIKGTVRLSRDTKIPNITRIEFERGSLSFSGASAHDVVIDLEGCRSVARAKLHHRSPSATNLAGEIAASYEQAFISQVAHFAGVIRGTEALRTTADEALRVQLLIDDCYASRQPMAMPWASLEEQAGIERLTQLGSPS